MNTIGWKMKLVKAWQRMLASYLRACVVALSAVAINEGGFNLSASQVGWSLLAAGMGPLLVFLTETADIIEPNDPPPQ